MKTLREILWADQEGWYIDKHGVVKQAKTHLKSTTWASWVPDCRAYAYNDHIFGVWKLGNGTNETTLLLKRVFVPTLSLEGLGIKWEDVVEGGVKWWALTKNSTGKQFAKVLMLDDYLLRIGTSESRHKCSSVAKEYAEFKVLKNLQEQG